MTAIKRASDRFLLRTNHFMAKLRFDTSHERFDPEEAVAGPSNRGFGIVFTVVFAVLALLPFAGATKWLHWAAVPAAALFIVALAAPAVLAPLNRVWTRFGLLFHRVLQPLVMGVIFFGVITPFGVLRRLINRDPLKLRCNRRAATYWIKRGPGQPAPETMKDQF